MDGGLLIEQIPVLEPSELELPEELVNEAKAIIDRRAYISYSHDSSRLAERTLIWKWYYLEFLATIFRYIKEDELADAYTNIVMPVLKKYGVPRTQPYDWAKEKWYDIGNDMTKREKVSEFISTLWKFIGDITLHELLMSRFEIFKIEEKARLVKADLEFKDRYIFN